MLVEGGRNFREEVHESQSRLSANLPNAVLTDASRSIARQLTWDNFKKAQAAGRRAAEIDREEELAAEYQASQFAYNRNDAIGDTAGLPSEFSSIEVPSPLSRDSRIENTTQFIAKLDISSAA